MQLGGVTVYWYGALYVMAFVLTACFLPRLQRWRQLALNRDQRWWLLVAGTAGVLIGGRLGYVFLYEGGYFLTHPVAVGALWQGGMSFHGGLVGVGVALWFFSRIQRISFWKITDVAMVPVALGLALGRVGNFINQELYGTLTSLPWGVTIEGVGGVRHPVQLYAAGKDLIIAAVCYALLRREKIQDGVVTSVFLMLYGVFRFVVEFWREPIYAPFLIGSLSLTPGQFLTLPLVIIGMFVLYRKNTVKII
jgi:phosphatidylglycerol:prolipoprotein diacylglycerol transferase